AGPMGVRMELFFDIGLVGQVVGSGVGNGSLDGGTTRGLESWHKAGIKRIETTCGTTHRKPMSVGCDREKLQNGDGSRI
ncbi:hypothetical protein HAX54_047550, partial [Datura stramonium]|nr:hypothetical protein [Datura stramonium]